MVVSNTGGSLPLLETFSRNTVRELRNCGCETTAVFGKDADGVKLRQQLRHHDIFCINHVAITLIIDWKFPEWDEPLPPSLVFLQSCLALKEEKVRGCSAMAHPRRHRQFDAQAPRPRAALYVGASSTASSMRGCRWAIRCGSQSSC